MPLFRLLLRPRRKRDPLVLVLIQERDYLRDQVASLQARINLLEVHVLDANDRLLVREGAYRKTEPTVAPTIDPTLHETDEEWAAKREREERAEHVSRMRGDPMFRNMVEEAADFDPAWAQVLNEYRKEQ